MHANRTVPLRLRLDALYLDSTTHRVRKFFKRLAIYQRLYIDWKNERVHALPGFNMFHKRARVMPLHEFHTHISLKRGKKRELIHLLERSQITVEKEYPKDLSLNSSLVTIERLLNGGT